MILTAKVKLIVSEAEKAFLLSTMETFNAACNYASERAFASKSFGRVKLQKLVYREVRDQFGLTAQAAVHVATKVSAAYAKNKKVQATFRLRGAMTYDDRILRWRIDKSLVSIWALAGRLWLPFVCGERQRELLAYRRGESDLVFVDDEFYLLASCDMPDPTEEQTREALGADFGINTLIATSDGDRYASAPIEKNRQRHQRLRSALQKRGSLSAKRHLRKLAKKQRRYQTDTNHVLAKRLVLEAKRTKRSLRIEDLTHIRERTWTRATTAQGKQERARRSNWAFAQLRRFIEYKAILSGVKVERVHPSHTSQRCFQCGHIEKGNRKSQSEFLCLNCNHAEHADTNAAKNIAFWAPVIEPIVSENPVKKFLNSFRGLRRRQASCLQA